MSYVLVSLWVADDDATPRSHAFAEYVNSRWPARSFIQGETVQVDALERAIRDNLDAPIVVFAHGGAGLSPRRGGDGIAAAELARAAPGRRVYAFACSTFVPQPNLDMCTFAERAVEYCVGTFVGHDAPVMTPFADQSKEPEVVQKLHESVAAMVEKFVAGEDDEAALRNQAWLSAYADVEIEIDLPSQSPEQGGFGWSSAAFLRTFFKSLCVRSKQVPNSSASALQA
jgi:hypothetical protein